MKRIILVLTICFVAATALAGIKKPIDELKGPIQNGISVLKDPTYHDDSKKELQREKIWEIVRQTFDFIQVSKRALARNWRDFTPQQRKEFTDAFAERLKNTYIDKIQGEFHNEEVVFLGEDMVSDKKAKVRTKLIRERLEVPIDYSMLLTKDGKWKIYDVNVEGVSLVQNYRKQFSDILDKDSPDQLIDRLKKDNAEQKKKRTGN